MRQSKPGRSCCAKNQKEVINLQNLTEHYLVAKRLDEFDKFWKEHEGIIAPLFGGAMKAYLLSARALRIGSVDGIKQAVFAWLPQADPGAKPRLGGWEFDELMEVIRSTGEGEPKPAMLEPVALFQGVKAKTAGFFVNRYPNADGTSVTARSPRNVASGYPMIAR